MSLRRNITLKSKIFVNLQTYVIHIIRENVREQSFVKCSFGEIPPPWQHVDKSKLGS